MTRGEFRDSTSRYMCTIPIVFIQYCCSSLPVVAVGSAYSRSLRVAAPLGTGGMTGGYGRPRRYDYAYARARAA